MKKFIACVLICSFVFTACGRSIDISETENIPSFQEVESISSTDMSMVSIDDKETSVFEDITSAEITDLIYEEPEFYGLDDADLIPYVKDNLYASMSSQFPSEDYTINMINAVYIPQEYIDELTNNSRSNIYFGKTEDELSEMFKGQRFAFTLDENNETTIEIINEYDTDALDKILLNVGIGCGVILVCVVVTVVTYGADVPPVVAGICAFSTAATAGSVSKGLSWGAIGGALSGAFEYYQTGDWDLALENAALAASEGFKYGAIFGAIEGGIKGELNFLSGGGLETSIQPTWQDSEKYVADLYGGDKQVSYLNGEIVKNTVGATRPDVVIPLDSSGAVNAIEVKNYNLANPNNLNSMIYTLKNEVSSRVINLPDGSVQTIVLDVRGRGFDQPIIDNAIYKIGEALIDIYPDIPIQIVA